MSIRTLTFAALISFFWQPLFAEPLIIPGSAASEPVLRALIKAYKKIDPKTEIIIPPSIGLEGGIRAVLNNQAELSRITRHVTPSEIEAGLRCILFGKDPVVFAIGESVQLPQSNLTMGQLVDIYSGKLTNWSQIGGSKLPVRVIAKGETDIREIMTLHYPGWKKVKVTPNAKFLINDSEIIEVFDQYRSSIGLINQSLLTMSKTKIKPIRIDGIEGNAENLKTGRYKAYVELGLAWKEGALSTRAQQFINFVVSKEGQKILTNYGIVPIPQGGS